MENKAVFFLNPFVENRVSFKAYEIIPKLGPSYSFQSDMIRHIHPKLSKVRSRYGFTFHEGESIYSQTKGFTKSALPKKIYYWIWHSIKNTRNNDFYEKYYSRFEFMDDLNEYLKILDLGIDIDGLKQCKNTGWLLISVGFLLRKFRSKLNI